jgi:dTDP-4-amino-4,6-dideoxygalactose transaminase
MIIPFEQEYRDRFYQLQEQIFESNFWSEGGMLRRFEQVFREYIKIGAKAVTNAGTALLAILEYIDVAGKDVVVPDNTFWATSQAVRRAGGTVIYSDCNKEDLCISLDDIRRKITGNTKVIIAVHIGGHIAFQIEEIADFCRKRGIYLVEDCAHVHGGWWNGKTGGHYGFAGAYSFYATKTMPLGDGGMIVSKDEEFLKWVEKYRNYGKEIVNERVTYPVKNGFNFRLNEFTAALGILQTERLPKIVEWKRKLAQKYDQIFERRVQFPKGMESGYYKYIVFDYPELKEQTGQVFGPGDLGTGIEGLPYLENSKWVGEHHQCVPIYYGYGQADEDAACLKKILLGNS